MTAPRQTVFDALEALVTARVTGSETWPVKTVSQRMTLPANVPPADLISVMIWEQPEDTEDKGFATPPVRTWSALLVVVFRNPDKRIPGATIINPILDQIDTLPTDFNSDVQTLGGLIYWLKILGKTVIETGDTDPNGLGGAVVPIKLLVP